jgi:signal transduction histidine kinase
MQDRSLPYRIGALLATPSRVVLYGFLLAFPGVPFVPWGRPHLIAVTAVAGALAALPLREHNLAQLARLVVVMALMLGTVRLADGPATSILLIGAFVSAAASTAQNFPFVYGLVAGIAIGALMARIFGFDFAHADRTFLSGQPWTPERSADESLRFAGFMFLAALVHYGRSEMARLESKATTAEAARDAAIADERSRIARELHDVVSHHVTAMTLQAEAAAMTGDKTALSAVATAGREALTELRRMLGVLRHPDDAPRGELDPQPDLNQLDQLAARTRSGPTVNLERRGRVRALSAGLELCAYRIVQESLTNSAKHSDATTVDVVLTYGESDLVVDVVDNGRPLVAARVSSGGLGLVGMRERVAMLDGELATGPRSGAQGYAVHARLPFDE